MTPFSLIKSTLAWDPQVPIVSHLRVLHNYQIKRKKKITIKISPINKIFKNITCNAAFPTPPAHAWIKTLVDERTVPVSSKNNKFQF